MLNQKQIDILILLLLLFPSSVVYSAWSEPTQDPTGGNASVPVYSEGLGQTIVGTLHVDPSAANPTSLQGSGSTNGIQGNSVGNALFGNLTNNAAGGGRAVYGLAVDAADYGLYTSGGLGLGVASGDIWFMQQDQGIAWPRESDGASLYGVYVTNTGELQVRGHGAGINFMDQNAASRLTVSEAGVVNVAAGGSLKVNNVSVCLQDGTNCPANVTPTLQQVTTAGNTSSNQILLTPAPNVEALRIVTSNWSPLVVRNAPNNADLFRVDQSGNAAAAGNITAAGQNVCRQDGTNCPAPPPPQATYWSPNGNEIYPTNSGAVTVKHNLWFDSFNQAQNVIDFDPENGRILDPLWPPQENYLLIKSGKSPSYNEKWHLRINRTGETIIGSDLYLGKGNGIASINANDPGENVSWAIRGKSGVPTIEAEPGPGGNPGGRGDINLKNGTLSTGYASLQNDLFLKNGKSIQVTDNAGNTSIQIGNYAESATFGYGTGKTASLAVEGDVKGNRLCFGNADCQSSWAGIAGTGGWADDGTAVRLTTAADNVGIGTAAPGAYKLNINGNMALQGQVFDNLDASSFYINGQGDVQIRVDANNNGNNSFKINNGSPLATGTTVFSVDENGNVVANGNATVGGQSVCRQDGTNCPGGSGVWGINGANIYNTNAGNVGIGTSLPGGYKLNVNGIMAIQGGTLNSTLAGPFYFNANRDFQVRIDADNNDASVESFSVNNGNNRTVFSVSENGVLSVQPNSATGATLLLTASNPQFADINVDLVGSSNNGDILFFRGAVLSGLGGKIGIAGNSSPASLLGIYGNVSIGGGYYGTAAPANGLLVEGNVGLGTNNPGTYKLNVNGNLALGTGGTLDSLDATSFFINGNGNVQIHIDADNNSPTPNEFRINSGPNFTVFSVDEVGVVRDATSYCLGANCKTTDWGPNSSAYAPDGQANPPSATRLYKALPTTNGFDYFCSPGFVVIGIKNTNPASLICGKMW